MENLSQSSTLTWRWLYKNIKTGATIADQTGEVFASVVLAKDKVSVDTGEFIPGQYRVNPYRIYRESYDPIRCTVRDYYSDGTYSQECSLDGNIGVYFANRAKAVCPLITSSVSNYKARVLQKAAGKLGDGGVSMGENLGEIRETIQLLRHPFKELRDFLVSSDYHNLGVLNTLRHYTTSGEWIEKGGKVISGKKAADVAAGTWLQFRYGLMPLIYTVQDAIKAVNRAVAKADSQRIRTVRASIFEETKVNLVSTSFGAQLGHTEFFCEVEGTDTMTFRACVQYRMEGVPSLAQLLKLTPRFLPETLYELTWLSFVVDWWLDIGAWLEALRFTPEIHVLGNTVGQKISRKVSVKASSAVSSTNGLRKTPRGVVGTYTEEYYERLTNQVLPSFPLFKLEFSSIKHTVDALALIHQLILSKWR